MFEQRLPTIDYERCTACGECVTACIYGALAMKDQRPIFSVLENCTYCSDCEAICPAAAITCDFEITWKDGD